MNAVLHALARAAVDATGAGAGCVFATDGEQLVVVAAAGEDTSGIVGARIGAGDTSAGFVVSSGQPMAVTVRPGEQASSGLAALLGRQPASVLCVPCLAEGEVVGAVELVDQSGGAMFTIDHIELATLLGDIAGPAIVDSGARRPAPPDPRQLGADLMRLADVDPVRYAAVAGAVSALLDHG